eukprot:TRINITY_DN10623_c0_g1_i1.p1 TRINITY_DN10623_c0_g1~~TRINITY_DN10623_c0_g1_i1.p1  ORF type:complete len:127 (+),score=19.65 TRINITY_DN10623_c0_g1_i1:66-446(+)
MEQLDELTIPQRTYIEYNLVRNGLLIYKYTLLSTTFNSTTQHALITWNIDPLDTMYEHNGKEYQIVEDIDGDGEVVEQIRIYEEPPHWPFACENLMVIPENISFPCEFRVNSTGDVKRYETRPKNK